MDVEGFSLRRPAAWPSSLRWGALVALSLIFAAALAALRLPAAPLLGPMVAGVLLAANGGAVADAAAGVLPSPKASSAS